MGLVSKYVGSFIVLLALELHFETLQKTAIKQLKVLGDFKGLDDFG